jgi:hypothetical protein
VNKQEVLVPQDVTGRILAEVETYLSDPSDPMRSAARANELLAELADCVRWLEEERRDLGERLSHHLDPARARRASTFMS